MKEIRLQWEPENKAPLKDIESRLLSYTHGKGGIIILRNGTLLSLTQSDDDVEDAKKAMNEARFMTDFRVVQLKEGGYMVAFHKAVSVFVGEYEFEEQKVEVAARHSELLFPGEVMLPPQDSSELHVLVGLYARGKLQRDAYFFDFYKRI